MTKVSAIYAKIPGICLGLDAELGCSLVQYVPHVAENRLSSGPISRRSWKTGGQDSFYSWPLPRTGIRKQCEMDHRFIKIRVGDT